MLRKAGLLCAALAMFSIAGGHWAALQTVAWAGMLRDYARTSGSLVTAVEQTFDGEHPCELCQAISVAKGRAKARSEPSSLASGEKLKFDQGDSKKCEGLGEGFHPWLMVSCSRWFSSVLVVPTPRGEPPPVPPPRLRAA